MVARSIELWDRSRATSETGVPTITYEDFMGDDAALHTALEAFKRFGFFIIKKSPTRLGVLEGVCDRIGYLKTTHYGEGNDVGPYGEEAWGWEGVAA